MRISSNKGISTWINEKIFLRSLVLRSLFIGPITRVLRYLDAKDTVTEEKIFTVRYFRANSSICKDFILIVAIFENTKVSNILTFFKFFINSSRIIFPLNRQNFKLSMYTHEFVKILI